MNEEQFILEMRREFRRLFPDGVAKDGLHYFSILDKFLRVELYIGGIIHQYASKR